MTTGIEKLFVSFVLLLLFHALLVMTLESLLAELVRGWVVVALLLCGLGGFVAGALGVAELDRFLQSWKDREDKPERRMDAD